MSDLVKRACSLLGVSPDSVLSSAEYADRVVLVVDNGIAGCPKHTVNIADLPTTQEPPKPKRTRRTTKKASK